MPRLFKLRRDLDVTGVSGVGDVAYGVEWPDGSASIQWQGDRRSVVHWPHVEWAEEIHGHNGATRLVYMDSDPLTVFDTVRVCPSTVFAARPLDQYAVLSTGDCLSMDSWHIAVADGQTIVAGCDGQTVLISQTLRAALTVPAVGPVERPSRPAVRCPACVWPTEEVSRG